MTIDPATDATDALSALGFTPDKLSALRAALRSPATELLVLEEKAAKLRTEVDALTLTVLEAGDYTSNYTGERVLDPGKLWMIQDGDAEECFRLIDLAVRERYDVKPGRCPALIAESQVRDARQALIDAATPFVPGFTYDRLALRLETLDRAIKLLVALAAVDLDKPAG